MLGKLSQVFLFFSFGLVYISAEIDFITPELPLLGARASPNAVWPQPITLDASTDLLYIKPKALPVTSNIQSCDIIAKAIDRYQLLFFPPTLIMNDPPASTDQILQGLTLNIAGGGQCEQYIDLKSNETYTLVVDQKNAVVEANTVWGLLRGLETFSQLVYINAQNYVVVNSSVYVYDYPRFRHRGVMLDSARHFIPVSVLKKNIDVMAYNKYNVFHWHLVDDQSFPFESTTYPDLSAKGAFSPDHVYSVADVADIIEHARLRGIRVIPEIDTPGHTYAFGKAMPELLTPCWAHNKPYQPIYGVQSDMELFNPSEPRVFSVMNGLLREIKDRFPSNYIHLGMDEVYDPCWRSNPDLKQWMEKMGIPDTTRLQAYYANQIFNITRAINVQSIVWQDVWDDGVDLPKDTIVHVWKGEDDAWADYIDNAAKQGYNVILSTPWYLNYISYGKYNTPSSVMNLEFFKYYEIEPLMHFTGSDEERQRILGGEACLWGEFVDGTNLLPRFWPRASAVAERLWSVGNVNNTNDAQFRLDVHRCRLLRRGIPAQPILDGFCGNYELGMPRSAINYPAFNYDTPIWTNVTTIAPRASTVPTQWKKAPSETGH